MFRLDAYDRELLRALDRLSPTTNDSVTVTRLAQDLGWSERFAIGQAWRLIEHRVIETDAGLGYDPTELYGRGPS